MYVRMCCFGLCAYIDPLSMSTSHRCCETFTGCGLWNASISSWLCSFTSACMVWCHSISLSTSSVSPIPIAAVCGRHHPHKWLTYTAVHCRWACVSGGWKPPLEQSAAWCHIQRSLFFRTASKLISFLPIISFLTVFVSSSVHRVCTVF